MKKRSFTNREVADETGLSLPQVRALAEVRGVERVGNRHVWPKKQVDEVKADLEARDERVGEDDE